MQITIQADKGKWLTDGTVYGKTILLAKGASADNFYEVTDEEYNEIMTAQEHLEMV